MGLKNIKLINRFGSVLATGQVADEGNFFGGSLDLGTMPEDMRELFQEFEEIVNGQMLSFLDEIRDKIAAHAVKAVFDDGHEIPVKDLQIFPSTGEVSFKLLAVAVKGRPPGDPVRKG